MRVLYHDTKRLPPAVEEETGATFTPLDDLLARSDFVSLHVTLTAETRHLIDARALARMQPTAVLVNTSRGPVVDTDALAAALRDATIWAAALDVTDPEPPARDSPLCHEPNILLTPHIAGAMDQARKDMGGLAIDEALRFIAGQPLQHEVTREMLPTQA